MGHESYSRVETVEGSSNRSFGLVFAAFFGILGLVPVLFGREPRLSLVAIAAVFAALASLAPSLLAPLNRLWTRLGLVLHRIVSPIALGIIFFAVITPIGLIMRMLGKDPLRLKLDSKVASYWIEREPPGPSAETLRDQF